MPKIAQIEQKGSWANGQGQIFYKSHVTLDEGTAGMVNATTPDRWNVGDEVIIKEVKQGYDGPALKIGRPDSAPFAARQGNQFSSQGSGSKQDKIEAQWALNAALNFHGLNPGSLVGGLEQLESTAREMIRLRDNLLK